MDSWRRYRLSLTNDTHSCHTKRVARKMSNGLVCLAASPEPRGLAERFAAPPRGDHRRVSSPRRVTVLDSRNSQFSIVNSQLNLIPNSSNAIKLTAALLLERCRVIFRCRRQILLKCCPRPYRRVRDLNNLLTFNTAHPFDAIRRN